MEKTLRYLTLLIGLLYFGFTANSRDTHRAVSHKTVSTNHLYLSSHLNSNSADTPTPVSICSGQSGTLAGPVIMPAPLTYTWQIFDGSVWVNAPGTFLSQNYNTASLTNTGPADVTDQIRREVTSTPGNGGVTYDSYYNVTISPTTPISNNTVSSLVNAFCNSGSPALTGTTPAGANGLYNYQWQSSADGNPGSFSDIAGANTRDYSPGIITVTTFYQRVVSSTDCVLPLTSNPFKITIQQPISNNSITAPASVTFCVQGSPATINGLNPAGGDGTYTYQWQSSTDQTNYVDINGATGVNYTPSAPLLVTTSFQRVVKTGGGCAAPSVSNPITITVYPNVDNSTNTLTLPTVASFCVQGDAESIIGSVPTGGSGAYTYQWQSSTDQNNWTNIPAPDGTGQDLDPPLLTQTTYYRRAVTSGVCTPPVVSASVAVTILPAVSNNSISLNPNPIVCGNGSIASIIGQTPQGGDGTYTYQWQSSGDGVTFTDIAQATGKELPPSQVSGTTYYRREVTSGVCTTPNISNIITVTVQPAIANNVVQPLIPNLFCISTDPAMLTGSTPTGGDGSTYTYQWQSSADNVTFTNITGAKGINYDPPVITATTYYQRLVTSGACTIPNVSASVSVVVYQQVANNIITAPAVSEFCVSGQAAQIAGAIPTQGDPSGYNYQWQSSTDNITFADIAGETNKDFTPPSLTATTYYRRSVVSGTCYTPVFSNVVAIIIDPPLAGNHILPQSFGVACTYTDPAVISGSFVSGGNGVYNYQWQRSTDQTNWTDITTDGTGIDYDPPPLTSTTYFRRLVTSGACIVPLPSTETATYTINATPAAPTVAPVTPICAGTGTTLTVVSPQSDLTYNWYDSPTSNTPVHNGLTFDTDNLIINTTFYLIAFNTTCSSPTVPIMVTVNPTPAAPALVNANASACYNSPLSLAVANPQSTSIYNWYIDPTGGNSFFTGTTYNVAAVVADLDFYVEETNGSGCISTSRSHQHVTATPALQVIANGQDGVCPGTAASIIAHATDPDATINWYTSKTGGTSIGNSLNDSPFRTPPVSANTTFWAEAVGNVNGCISPERVSALVTVLTPLDAPVVTVNDATTSSITFSWAAVDGAASYQVSIDGGTTFTNSSSGGDGLTTVVTDLKADQSITLVVKAIGSAACQASTNSAPVTGTTTNPIADQLYVANAFTPNGDGNNDIVYVHNEKIKSMKFYVYDQWGELLYSSFNQQNGWDGTFKGKKEPVGVYVYYVEAVLTDGKQVKKKGTITLLR